jgi:hypothetical protein
MRSLPARLSGIKLQHPMLGGTMFALTHVPDVDAPASLVVSVLAYGGEPH